MISISMTDYWNTIELNKNVTFFVCKNIVSLYSRCLLYLYRSIRTHLIQAAALYTLLAVDFQIVFYYLSLALYNDNVLYGH